MPTPIICIDHALRQFALRFRSLFSKPQWQHFVTVLLALLLCSHTRKLTALHRTVVTSTSYPALTRWLADAPWSATDLVDVWLNHWHRQLNPLVLREAQRQRAAAPPRRGRQPKPVVTGYLIGDDSTMHKPKGKKMQALGHHYSTTARKSVLGHSLVAALYTLLGRRVPLAPRLYRTKAAAEAEKVPFVDKLDLMVQIIAEFTPVAGTRTHVLLDSWYSCGKIWRAAKQRGFALTCGLKSNRWLKVLPAAGATGGQWVKLPEYAASLTAADYEVVERPTSAGGRVYVHIVRARVRKLGSGRVVILRTGLDAPLTEARYWVTSELSGSAAEVVGHITMRWQIEVLFADSKELLGLDHYQTISSAGLVRWWTVVLLAYVFLEEERAVRQEQGLELTIGEMQREVQQVHQRHLLEWLYEQFRDGATARQVWTMLAA